MNVAKGVKPKDKAEFNALITQLSLVHGEPNSTASSAGNSIPLCAVGLLA